MSSKRRQIEIFCFFVWKLFFCYAASSLRTMLILLHVALETLEKNKFLHFQNDSKKFSLWYMINTPLWLLFTNLPFSNRCSSSILQNTVSTRCSKKQGKKIWQLHFRSRDCKIKTKHQKEFQVKQSFEQKAASLFFIQCKTTKFVLFWDKLNLIIWVLLFSLLRNKTNLLLKAIKNWWSGNLLFSCLGGEIYAGIICLFFSSYQNLAWKVFWSYMSLLLTQWNLKLTFSWRPFSCAPFFIKIYGIVQSCLTCRHV